MAQLQTNIRKRTSKKMIITGLIISCLLIISSILLLLYPFASKEKERYFLGDNPILYKGKQIGNAIFENEAVYLPLTFLKEQIDSSIHFDDASNSIIVTTKDKVVQMPSESLTYYVNEKPVELQFSAFLEKDNEMYLPLAPLVDYFPVEYKVLPDSRAVEIRTNGEQITNGTITSDDTHEEKLRLRKGASLQTPYVAEVALGEHVSIDAEKEDYYFVRKADGTAGYIQKKLVAAGETTEVVINRESAVPKLPAIDGPINLTWEAVYSKNPETAKMPQMPGVNVISPTWFELAAPDGAIKNLASLEFSQWANKQGYQVWGLFSNAFDPQMTHEAFKSFEKRQYMIRQLLHYSKMYGLQGINIDIENVNEEDGPLITQFMREATPYFHDAGLIVSMDITFISNSGNWSAFYERDQLAEIVDYLAVMAYDEHWGTSPVAGSVASLPWVESNLQTLLEIVPNEKLILGVPLYTRLWEVKDSGEVSSKALSMASVQEWLEETGAAPVYDTVSGQNYAEYYDAAQKATYKIWLEDAHSLKKRADLAVQYELAGVASWSRYFADDTAWTALVMNQQENLTKK